jgi:hypothetical protein
VRCFSYPPDQDHVHSTSIAKFPHQELACSTHPPNKYSMCYVISLQVSLKKIKIRYGYPIEKERNAKKHDPKKERKE